MTHTRSGNAKLAALIAETGMSHAQVARAVVRVAAENDVHELASTGRSHVSHWVGGSRPSGRAPAILCEVLSRRLGRQVTPADIGLASEESPVAAPAAPNWRADTLMTLADLGRADVDAERRRVLGAAAYSLAGLALPDTSWWAQMANRGRARGARSTHSVGGHDLAAVRDVIALFSKIDQRHGGGHARTAVVQYLASDVASFLRGSFADDAVRRDMFSAASELAYLAGWMAFDNHEHAYAQHYFTLAVQLAAEADDPPMAGHVLRAMAHQALDLGHRRHALDLAAASVDGKRYALASPRERALIGVVYARALAVNGDKQAAATALLRAEDDLAGAAPGDDEPGRVFFFGEASLAHETACALRDTGDLDGAIRKFRHSVRTRIAATFTRTHAVTLGYLGAVQAQQRDGIEQACTTWSTALDAMEGIHSGRTRQVAAHMRSVLSPFRPRGIAQVAEVDARAAAYLKTAP